MKIFTVLVCIFGAKWAFSSGYEAALDFHCTDSVDASTTSISTYVEKLSLWPLDQLYATYLDYHRLGNGITLSGCNKYDPIKIAKIAEDAFKTGLSCLARHSESSVLLAKKVISLTENPLNELIIGCMETGDPFKLNLTDKDTLNMPSYLAGYSVACFDDRFPFVYLNMEHKVVRASGKGAAKVIFHEVLHSTGLFHTKSHKEMKDEGAIQSGDLIYRTIQCCFEGKKEFCDLM
ncbi:MAG: hypothetical protein HOE90_10490 [Bacteriovoracaceae bacterium]|jgi:hypothetical protein|nr:hypothetical protein [Bacteriovoracaceae bacterium]